MKKLESSLIVMFIKKYFSNHRQSGQINEMIPQQIDKSTNRQIDKSTNRQIDKSTNRQIDKYLVPEVKFCRIIQIILLLLRPCKYTIHQLALLLLLLIPGLKL